MVAEQAGISSSQAHQAGQCHDGNGTEYIFAHFSFLPLFQTGTEKLWTSGCHRPEFAANGDWGVYAT